MYIHPILPLKSSKISHLPNKNQCFNGIFGWRGIKGSLARSVGRAFFNFTAEEKLKYACDPTASATEGYENRMLENDDVVLDWWDYFDHHTLPLSRPNPSRWPHSPSDYGYEVVDRVLLDCVPCQIQVSIK